MNRTINTELARRSACDPIESDGRLSTLKRSANRGFLGIDRADTRGGKTSA